MRLPAKTVAFCLGGVVGATSFLLPRVSAGVAAVALAAFVFWVARILRPEGRPAAVAVALVFTAGIVVGAVTTFAALFFYLNWVCTHRNECL